MTLKIPSREVTSAAPWSPRGLNHPLCDVGVIDGCAFPAVPDTKTLTSYMSKEMAELLLKPGDKGGPAKLESSRLYSPPSAAWLGTEDSGEGLALGERCARTVVGHDRGM